MTPFNPRPIVRPERFTLDGRSVFGEPVLTRWERVRLAFWCLVIVGLASATGWFAVIFVASLPHL